MRFVNGIQLPDVQRASGSNRDVGTEKGLLETIPELLTKDKHGIITTA